MPTTGEKPGKGAELPRRALAVGLGTLTSGIALLFLSWLSGLNIAGKPLVAPLGFLFGLGMSLAVYGPPGVSTCRDVLRASWRVALGAAFSVLTQLLFILAKDKGLAITIAWPGTRYRAYLSATVERLWPDLGTRFPWWTDALGFTGDSNRRTVRHGRDRYDLFGFQADGFDNFVFADGHTEALRNHEENDPKYEDFF